MEEMANIFLFGRIGGSEIATLEEAPHKNLKDCHVEMVSDLTCSQTWDAKLLSSLFSPTEDR